MPGTINVDTTDETITVDFADDKGNEATAPPGAVATFTSSDDTVATVSPDADNAFKGDIAPAGAPGTVQLGVTFNGTAIEADGTTPIPDPDPVSLEVDPGAAVGARLTLS